MESEWSLLMLMGPVSARLAHGQHDGQPGGRCHIRAAHTYSARPAGGSGGDGPAAGRLGADAGGHGASARILPSTNSVFTLPSATYWAKYWGISVEGVMGKCAHHVGIDLAHGRGNRLVAAKSVAICSYQCSLLPKSDGVEGTYLDSRCRSPCSGRKSKSPRLSVRYRDGRSRDRRARTAGTACIYSVRQSGSLVRHSPVL